MDVPQARGRSMVDRPTDWVSPRNPRDCQLFLGCTGQSIVACPVYPRFSFPLKDKTKKFKECRSSGCGSLGNATSINCLDIGLADISQIHELSRVLDLVREK